MMTLLITEGKRKQLKGSSTDDQMNQTAYNVMSLGHKKITN